MAVTLGPGFAEARRWVLSALRDYENIYTVGLLTRRGRTGHRWQERFAGYWLPRG